MNIRYFFIIFSFYIVLLPAFANPVITWYKHDIPPFYIKSGPLKNKGIGDLFQSFLESKLPEYEHKIIYANIVRAEHDSLTNPLFASLTFYTTPAREKYLLFSEPYGVNVPPKLFFLPENRSKFEKYLTSNNSIDLNQMISDGNIIINLPTGRYYSDTINSIIEKNKYNKNIHFNYSESFLENSLLMISLQRSDCFIEFENILNYIIAFKNINLKLNSLSIEDSNTIKFSSVSVSKNTDGEILIKKINSILLKYRYSDELINIFTSFSSPEYKSEYKKLLIEGVNKYYNN